MADKPNILKIKQTRKQILTNLNLLYPSAIRLDSLYRTVCHIDPEYSKSLFIKDISYFVQKRFIEFIDDQIGGADEFMHKVVHLTANGKEVAEGTYTDEALEI